MNSMEILFLIQKNSKTFFFIFNGNHQQCNWTFHKNVIFKNTSTFTLQEKDEVPEGKYLKQL